MTRLAYGSVGPRPVLVVDESGMLADPAAPDEAKAPILERMFAGRQPLAAIDAGQPRVPPGDAAGPRRGGRPADGDRAAGGGE